MLETLYRPGLTLLTDLYQLTMGFAYWKSGMAEREAVFHLTFRRAPFRGSYALACGLGTAIEQLRSWQFTAEDCRYLGSLPGADGRPLFRPEFLEYLAQQPFACDVDAVPEGTAVFPHEPLVRVRGPLLQAQIAETMLLNVINFQSLIATKAARIRKAAGEDEVLEFGLRRAQGIDGGMSASRAAFVGGCDATSNVLAGKTFGIPVRGTHAHSWVMAFPNESEAFRTYAQAMPNNCLLLVDTYDTVTGVRRAIEIAQELKRSGHPFLGIRLDSGDLADLSQQARALLDAAGLQEAKIVGSGDLDEHRIVELKQRGARIDIWGVGSRLVTGHDDPALGGIYKLSAIRDESGTWQRKMKLSNDPAKASFPGILQVRRSRRDGQFTGDLLYDLELGIADPSGREPSAGKADPGADLLVPIFRRGACVYSTPSLPATRALARAQLASLPEAVQRWQNPETYAVTEEPRLQAARKTTAASL